MTRKGIREQQVWRKLEHSRWERQPKTAIRNALVILASVISILILAGVN